MATLGFAIVGVIVVNGVFSFWQVYRAERALAALEKLLPHQVKVQRGGVFLQIPAAGLVPGDVISLEAGDLIPADCRLIEGFGIRVNVATVTGESLPKARDAHPSTEETSCTAGMLCWQERRSFPALARLSSAPRGITPSSGRSPT